MYTFAHTNIYRALCLIKDLYVSFILTTSSGNPVILDRLEKAVSIASMFDVSKKRIKIFTKPNPQPGAVH